MTNCKANENATTYALPKGARQILSTSLTLKQGLI